MKRALVVALLFFTALLRAQTPAPFVGLLTTGTDVTTTGPWLADVWYTTNGAGVPGNYFGPAYGGTKTDAIFGTTSYRPPIQNNFPTAGGCQAANLLGITVDYSKIIPQSRDGSNLLFPDPCGWDYIFTATTSGALSATSLRRIQIDSTTNSFATDGADFVADESDWTFCQNTATSNCNNTIYYIGRKVNNGPRVVLKSYNITTNTSTNIFDFTTAVTAMGGTDVDNGREGNPDESDRYFAYMVTNPGAGTTQGMLVYDRTANAVLASKTVGASGICGTSACSAVGGDPNNFANWVGVCGDGTTTYVITNSNTVASRPWTMQRGLGTWVFDINLNVLGIADYQNGHADCGKDKSGNWVYATVPFETFHVDAAAIATVNLAAVSATVPATNNPQWSGMVENGFPCLRNFNDTVCTTDRGNNGGFTISMRGSHGTQQGAMVFSAFCATNGTLTCNGGWNALENDILMLDWAAGIAPGTGVQAPAADRYRVSRTHAINSEYFTQADGVCNWDCTRLFYTSSGDINNGPSPAQLAANMLPTAQQVYHMPLIIALPLATPTLTTITVLPNPATVANGGTFNMATNSFCTFSDSTTVAAGATGCVVVWTDSNAHTTINSSTGVVTGVSTGSDTITATLSPATPGTATINSASIVTGFRVNGLGVHNGNGVVR